MSSFIVLDFFSILASVNVWPDGVIALSVRLVTERLWVQLSTVPLSGNNLRHKHSPKDHRVGVHLQFFEADMDR